MGSGTWDGMFSARMRRLPQSSTVSGISVSHLGIWSVFLKFFAQEAMVWGTAAGLLEGYGDGTLGPKNPVTRVQMAKFLTILSKAF